MACPFLIPYTADSQEKDKEENVKKIRIVKSKDCKEKTIDTLILLSDLKDNEELKNLLGKYDIDMDFAIKNDSSSYSFLYRIIEDDSLSNGIYLVSQSGKENIDISIVTESDLVNVFSEDDNNGNYKYLMKIKDGKKLDKILITTSEGINGEFTFSTKDNGSMIILNADEDYNLISKPDNAELQNLCIDTNKELLKVKLMKLTFNKKKNTMELEFELEESGKVKVSLLNKTGKKIFSDKKQIDNKYKNKFTDINLADDTFYLLIEHNKHQHITKIYM